jgi:excisionase family DNA binding protein
MCNSTNTQTTIGKLLTAKCVAEVLDCSVRHVWRLASTGELPRTRVGGLVRFRLSDLEKLMGGQANGNNN